MARYRRIPRFVALVVYLGCLLLGLNQRRNVAIHEWKNPLVVVLSLPKSGTTSLNAAFLAANLKTVHYDTHSSPWILERWAHERKSWKKSNVGPQYRSQYPQWNPAHEYIGRLVENNNSSDPFGGVLDGVEAITEMNYDYFECMDGKIGSRVYYPQTNTTFVRSLLRMYPTTKYILSVRNSSSWARSVSAWYDTLERFVLADLPYLPPGVGSNFSDLEHFYEEHTKRVKETVPEDRLLVFSLEDDSAEIERRLRQFLSLPDLVWPHSNKNVKTSAASRKPRPLKFPPCPSQRVDGFD